MMDPILAALPHVRGGRLKALAITSSKRVAIAPDLPTVAESALPGFEFYSWYGIWAPRGTPKAVVERLAHEIAALVKLPDVASRLTAQGFEPIGSTPQQFDKYIAAETEKYAKIVKQADIKAE